MSSGSSVVVMASAFGAGLVATAVFVAPGVAFGAGVGVVATAVFVAPGVAFVAGVVVGFGAGVVVGFGAGVVATAVFVAPGVAFGAGVVATAVFVAAGVVATEVFVAAGVAFGAGVVATAVFVAAGVVATEVFVAAGVAFGAGVVATAVFVAAGVVVAFGAGVVATAVFVAPGVAFGAGDVVVRVLTTRYVAVGNEPFLDSYNGTFDKATFAALQNIQNVLNGAGLSDVKATVPLNADVYNSRHPTPPYLSLYLSGDFPVDLAFFEGQAAPVLDGSISYNNVFDTLVSAFKAVGHGDLPIFIGEVGCPTGGDRRATAALAERFYKGLLKRLAANTGTPLRPKQSAKVYLFGHLDEDVKSVAPGAFEPHWVILRFDDQPKFPIDLTGLLRVRGAEPEGRGLRLPGARRAHPDRPINHRHLQLHHTDRFDVGSPPADASRAVRGSAPRRKQNRASTYGGEGQELDRGTQIDGFDAKLDLQLRSISQHARAGSVATQPWDLGRHAARRASRGWGGGATYLAPKLVS
ncbi:hypothetical protein QYE76_001757 [Lolium multiflorum]|uniref:Glucan endo-1,3-beta-D-glucosidase n=1 Tax=Lolium multiflorum TaxID=4521 RepID=A0AAD8RMQ3_LOLMU|nr:hypothetical protein QYE76_001757 [Lolium multiflorum]